MTTTNEINIGNPWFMAVIEAPIIVVSHEHRKVGHMIKPNFGTMTGPFCTRH